jgi:hypothetical protein
LTHLAPRLILGVLLAARVGASVPLCAATPCSDPELTLFKHGDPRQAAAEFAPEEQIFLALRCLRLPKGEFTFHVDWFNPGGGLQEQNELRVTQAQAADYTVRAWLKLLRQSMGRRFVAGSDVGYRAALLGAWRVKIFLDGTPIAEAGFQVK